MENVGAAFRRPAWAGCLRFAQAREAGPYVLEPGVQAYRDSSARRDRGAR